MPESIDSPAPTAILLDYSGPFVRIGPAACINGTFCFVPPYRPTRTRTRCGVKRAITMWKNRIGTEQVIGDEEDL